jgi:hypothetical protein
VGGLAIESPGEMICTFVEREAQSGQQTRSKRKDQEPQGKE